MNHMSNNNYRREGKVTKYIKRKNVNGIIIVIVYLLHILVVPLTSAPHEAILGFDGDWYSYCDNSEYKSRYREGETLFGTSIATRLHYNASPRWSFGVGFYGNRRFGDDHFFKNAYPVFRITFSNGNTVFVFGQLFDYNNHDMPDLLLKSETYYESGPGEGMQLQYESSFVAQDLWIDWHALNTPKQREHFRIGNRTSIKIYPFTFPVMLIADHFGGETYAPDDDPVRESYGAGTGVQCGIHSNDSSMQLGCGLLLLVSASRIRPSSYENGFAALSDAYWSLRGYKIALHYFYGNDFRISSGNPMYRTNNPYYELDISKRATLSRSIVIDGGMNIGLEQFASSLNGATLQYRFWFTLQYTFGFTVID